MDKLYSWYQAHTWALIPTVYLFMSLVAYLYYAVDKRAAKRGAWRTPESTLHIIELLGGWPGAWLAQKQLHHKCSKTSYQIEFFVMVALNLIGLAYIIYGLATSDWTLSAWKR